MQTLAEDLLLLALDDDQGTVSWSRPASELSYGLGGALLMDLALLGRVAGVDQKIVPAESAPIEDAVLDAALDTIRAASKPQDAKHWVKKLGDQKGLKEQLAHRLVDRGILREEAHTLLWVFHDPRYPTADPVPEATIRNQIRSAVLDHAEPEARTLLLLSLVQACNLTDHVFAHEERREAKQRIKELIEDEQIGQAVGEAVGQAVREVVVATMAAITAATFSTTIATGAHR